MDELDQHSEALLAAFREVDAFTNERQSAVRRRVMRSSSRPAPSWLAELDATPRPPAGARRNRRGWWIGALAAAAILLAVLATRRSAVQREPHPAAAAAISEAVGQTPRGKASPKADRHEGTGVSDAVRETSQTTSPTRPAPATPPAVPDDTTARPHKAHGSGERRRGQARTPRPTSTPNAPPGADPPGGSRPTLADELALLDAVDRSLRAGATAAAERDLRAYATRFPRGQLTVEAAGLRATLRCAQGRDGAQAAGRAYLTAHPRAVIRARLARTCDLKKVETEPTDSDGSVQLPGDDKP